MNVLIVHQNFPGQFPHIADALVKRGDKVAAIGSQTAKGRPGVDLRRWDNKRSTAPGIFPQAVRAEADLIRATAAAAAALQLKKDGFAPDVIIGHPGWGETIHLKEVWPDARLIVLGEYYYRSRGGDSGFDPEFGEPSVERALMINAKAATQTLAYVLADRIICPTPFQASTFPATLQAKIKVIHEGIDVERARRKPGATVKLPGGKGVLDGSKPVVTLVNRTLEPLRGFHIFMRALPAFFEACPDACAVVVGLNLGQGYGGRSPVGENWLDWAKADLGDRLDWSRVHFLGQVQHEVLIDLFSISWAHVYYTYPFVLSWSLLEAMACECLVLASDTAPVRDAVIDGENGVLLPFFDVPALSVAMMEAVENPERFAALRLRVRHVVTDHYDTVVKTAELLAEISLSTARQR